MGIMGRKRANVDGNTATTGSPNTKVSGILSKLLRVLQFLSATTSLILFSIRLAKIVRLTRKASKSNGAVEGILAAAVLYTIIATLLQLCIRSGTGRNKPHTLIRVALVIFDLLFVVAFIVVAVLTSPKRHGSSSPCNAHSTSASLIGKYGPSQANCNLPWGTFILAIFSALLHAITAAYHGFRQHQKMKNGHVHDKHDAGYAGNGGQVHGDAYNNGVSGNGVQGTRY